MSEVDDFLSEMMPRFLRAADAMHHGDPSLFVGLWSRRDPGDVAQRSGDHAGWMGRRDRRPEVDRIAVLQPLAARFELLAPDVDGDMAYTVGYERSQVSVHGGSARPVFLRATQIYPGRTASGTPSIATPTPDAGSPGTDALKDALQSAPEKDPLPAARGTVPNGTEGRNVRGPVRGATSAPRASWYPRRHSLRRTRFPGIDAPADLPA